VKNKKEQQTSNQADLTSTVRSIATGQKKQKILVLRWGKSGDIEVKCEGGKWAKQTAGPEIDDILKMVTDVLQKAPLDAREPVEFSLPTDLEQEIVSILNNLETTELNTDSLPCYYSGSSSIRPFPFIISIQASYDMVQIARSSASWDFRCKLP